MTPSVIKPKTKNIYVVAAHLDDVEIGLFTYLKRMTLLEHTIVNISIYVASTGLYNKPAELNKLRKATFFKNLDKIRFHDAAKETKMIGSLLATVCEEALDTDFPEEFSSIRYNAERFIKSTFMPRTDNETENIFIYNSPDIHRDHTVINDICKVIARPVTQGGQYDFQEVLNFNIPSNDYQDYGLSQPQNTGCILLELTKEEIKNKKEVINNYFQAGIIKQVVKKKDLKIEKLNLIYKRY